MSGNDDDTVVLRFNQPSPSEPNRSNGTNHSGRSDRSDRAPRRWSLETATPVAGPSSDTGRGPRQHPPAGPPAGIGQRQPIHPAAGVAPAGPFTSTAAPPAGSADSVDDPPAGSGDSTDGPTVPPGRARHRRSSPSSSGGDRAWSVLGVTGELLITMGVVVLLFVAYEVYVTDWISAGKQRDATAALDEKWSDPTGSLPADANDPAGDSERTEKFRPGDGEGFAKLYVPAFGSDFVFTVLEGTSDPILEIGPGHYKDSAFPGEPGNFSVAGHRVGKGAPFNDLDLLRSCDALVVETQRNWTVYRVLPMREEIAGWATGRGADPRCADVQPLGDPYSGVVGQQIVLPSQSGVVAPVPDRPDLSLDEVPPTDRAALITLTTCHPRFSAAKRLILHGVLVKQYPKDPANPGARPAELTEG